MLAPFLRGPMPGVNRPIGYPGPAMPQQPFQPQPIGPSRIGPAPAQPSPIIGNQFHTMPGIATGGPGTVGIGPTQPQGFNPMQGAGGQPPIASFDNLKRVHTIKKSGLYRLKKGEKVVPLSSLARAE